MDHETFNSSRRSVEVDGDQLSYADVGEGPPAVFVHGVFTSCHLWRTTISQLRHDRRCIAPDLAGHGRTEISAGRDLALPAQVEILARLCDVLELERIDLVANDTGGAIAQIFAARYPERLRTLTLTNCDVADQLPPDAFKDAAEAAERGELAPTMVQLAGDELLARSSPLAQCYERPDRIPAQTIQEYLSPFADPERALQLERIVASLKAEDLRAVEPLLAELEVPTLIVWGTDDVFFELKWAYWLRDAIAGARDVVEIPGGKLFFPDERAEDLVPHVREHWAAHADAAVAR